ncbi:hypothetical protein K439DRAFT_1659241 [Ramaria rubella]|nr:hypothetical protein K439DRAFT_1659241 [Ramaria rubella]
MAPILLNYAASTQSSDEAGTMITRRVLPGYNPGPYTHYLLPDHLKPPDTLYYVPSLQYFCVKSLCSNVDSINLGGFARLRYCPKLHPSILKTLIPFFETDTRDVDMKYVDPRLWGTLIQLYSQLPACFRTYTLPLSDTHLTQLQCIHPTADFTLITVLDLSARPEVTDDTIGALKLLTNLCVLDLSNTSLSSWGVKKLSMCLVGTGHERIGPWNLRVWSLRECGGVDESVNGALARFPLLTVVDLRGTSMKPYSHLTGFTSRPPTSHQAFYYPIPPLSWTIDLCKAFPNSRIFESQSAAAFHVLHINKLEYSKSVLPSRGHALHPDEQDRVLALFPNGKQALHTTHNLSVSADSNLGKTQRTTAQRGYPGWDDREDDLDWSHMDRDRNARMDFHRGFEYDSGNSEDGLSEDMYDSFGYESGNLRGDTVDSSIDPNEVAAMVMERDVAEQEARNFYQREPFLKLFQLLRGTNHLSSPPQVLPPSDRELSMMFFRTPPAFDSISDDKPNAETCRNADDDILPKRRRTGAARSDIPQILLDRRRVVQKDSRTTSPTTRTVQATEIHQPSLSSTNVKNIVMQANQTRNVEEGPKSMNPFLAKAKTHISTLSAPPSQPAKPPTLPMLFATPKEPGKKPQKARPSDAKDSKPGRKIKGKGKEVFDMKMWAIKKG